MNVGGDMKQLLIDVRHFDSVIDAEVFALSRRRGRAHENEQNEK